MLIVGRTRRGTEVSVEMPEDPNLWFSLLVIALVLVIFGMVLSGVRWRELSINPWSSARAAVNAAVRHGEMRFWLVWILFSVAAVLVIAAAFVSTFRMLGN